MPHKGVYRQRPVPMAEAGGLQQGEEATQKVIGAEKGVDRPAHGFAVGEVGGHAQIHGDAAKLKGEDPPLKAAMPDDIVIKQQLVPLRRTSETALHPVKSGGSRWGCS